MLVLYKEFLYMSILLFLSFVSNIFIFFIFVSFYGRAVRWRYIFIIVVVVGASLANLNHNIRYNHLVKV